jgi:tellurite resistance protein TerC
MLESVGSPLLIGGFLALVAVLLAFDLGVVRRSKTISMRQALAACTFYVALALAFDGWLWWRFGATAGLEFLTGYIIEYALSVDNLFVFIIVFRYFAVKPEHQYRALFWGIIGALILRAIFVIAGAALIASFHWIIYVFGAFLVYTGIKILTQKEELLEPEKNPVVRLFRRFVPCTPDFHGDRFVVKLSDGRRYATPLLVVLLVIESVDVIFAVDSIPAVFAVTRDPFIVFTSNIFAILGLRALYFLIAGGVHKFHLLKVGIAVVLVFVGVKMLIADLWRVPIVLSLSIVILLLAGSILASILIRPREETREASR